MTAWRQGFIDQEYRARKNYTAGIRCKLAPGQEMKHIDFSLTPQAI